MIFKLVLLVTLYFILNYLSKIFKDNPIHKKIASYLDYVFIFRPTLLFAIWFIICLGMYSAYLASNYMPQWMNTLDIKTSLLFASISFIISSIFIKEDEDNLFKKENYLDKNIVRLLSNISLYIGLLLALFINIYNLFLGLSLYFCWYFLYNKDIVKNNFFIRCLTHIIMSIILLFSGFFIVITNNDYFLLASNISIESIVFILLSCLCLLSIFLFIELIKNNDTFLTTNRRYISFFSTILLILVIIISIITNEPLLSICAVSSIPFYIYSLLRNLDKDIIRSVKYPLFIFNFFVATLFPYLGLALFTIFWISKYYYWYRFNINYPTFLIDND